MLPVRPRKHGPGVKNRRGEAPKGAPVRVSFGTLGRRPSRWRDTPDRKAGHEVRRSAPAPVGASPPRDFSGGGMDEGSAAPQRPRPMTRACVCVCVIPAESKALHAHLRRAMASAGIQHHTARDHAHRGYGFRHAFAWRTWLDSLGRVHLAGMTCQAYARRCLSPISP
jgi:hypothetical protein